MRPSTDIPRSGSVAPRWRSSVAVVVALLATSACAGGSSDSTATMAADSAPQEPLAFASDRDTSREIYLMNVDGSGLQRLTDNPADDGGPCLVPRRDHDRVLQQPGRQL